PISEADMFDMEYWPLEQAKLNGAADKPLTGQIAVVTGAAGAARGAPRRVGAGRGGEGGPLRGRESARPAPAQGIARPTPGGAGGRAVRCDVTSAVSVRNALDKVVAAFGGLDIVVSNAGAAWQGRIGEVDEEVLRKSFELNFYGHQRVAQAAVKIMLAQGTGG